MVPPIFVPYIKRTHIERLVQLLDDCSERINAISRNYLRKKHSKMSAPRVAQFVTLGTLKIAFGLDRGTTFWVFSSPQAGLVRDHIARLTGRFPGLSSAHRRIQQVAKEEGDAMLALAGDIQDAFATGVGNGARTAYSDLLASGTRATAPADCFIGILPPSKAFPGLDPAARGRLLPFLNAWVYMHATRVSGVMELLGELKRPEIAGREVSFPLVEELGFIAAPPGKNAMYHAFQQIEANLAPLDAIATEQLAGLGAINLTVSSVDTTNVPVDKRDKTGSVGTGSRGTFFGHKASLGTSATCLPASYVLGSGRQADSAMFGDTFGSMVDLARATGQDMWLTAVDAGYAQVAVLTRIENAGAIPLADINPKNSPLLGRLKAKANELVDLSRKAFRKGLTLAERKEWQAGEGFFMIATRKPLWECAMLGYFILKADFVLRGLTPPQDSFDRAFATNYPFCCVALYERPSALPKRRRLARYARRAVHVARAVSPACNTGGRKGEKGLVDLLYLRGGFLAILRALRMLGALGSASEAFPLRDACCRQFHKWYRRTRPRPPAQGSVAGALRLVGEVTGRDPCDPVNWARVMAG